MKIRSNLWLILVLSLFSCTEIYFTEPQPRGVKILENGLEELAGEYINPEDSDTLRVSEEGVIWSNDDTDDEEALSGQVIVKKYKGRFFVNFLNTEKNLWLLFIVSNSDPEYINVVNMTSIDEDKVEQLLVKKYAKMIENESGDEKYILLNPSKGQLIKLLKSPILDEEKVDLKRLKPK